MKHDVMAVKVGVFFFCLFLAIPLSAQQKTTKPEQVSGEVVGVDLQKNFMSLVTKEGKAMSIDFSPQTKVTKSPGQTKAEIKDIKRGDSASVMFRTEGARPIASSVVFSRPGGCPDGPPC